MRIVQDIDTIYISGQLEFTDTSTHDYIYVGSFDKDTGNQTNLLLLEDEGSLKLSSMLATSSGIYIAGNYGFSLKLTPNLTQIAFQRWNDSTETFGIDPVLVEWNSTTIAAGFFVTVQSNILLGVRLMDATDLTLITTLLYPSGPVGYWNLLNLASDPAKSVVYFAASISNGSNYFNCVNSTIDQYGVAIFAISSSTLKCLWGLTVFDTENGTTRLYGLDLSFDKNFLAVVLKADNGINVNASNTPGVSSASMLKIAASNGTTYPAVYFDISNSVENVRFDLQGNMFALSCFNPLKRRQQYCSLTKISGWTVQEDWSDLLNFTWPANFIMDSQNLQNFYTTYNAYGGGSFYKKYQQTIYPSVSTTPSPSPIPRSSSKKNNTALIVGVVVGGSVAIALAAVAILFVRRSKHQKSQSTAQIELRDSQYSEIRSSKIASLPQVEDIEILNKIGSGNFGEVFKGRWKGKIDVALKKLKNRELQDEFFQEASMMQQLDMPNVVKFYGIFIDSDGYFYLVTEFMNRGCLLDVLRDISVRLQVTDLLRMAVDSAAGMNFIVSKEIIHRDLAARNLLVTEENGQLLVKVADFGLSRLMTSEYYSSTGSMFPIKWCPPEVLQFRKYTVKSDIWSFGVVLWELFSYGQTPYPNKSNDEAMNFVLAGGRLDKPADCPEKVYQLMQRCWQEDPSQRPDFDELCSALTSIQKEYVKYQNF